VTQVAGITHTHNKPVLDHQLDNIMSWVCSVGAAVAAADYDNDGWVDLYVTNSHLGTPNFLYHNNRDGTFTDVAKKAGLDDLNGSDGASMHVIFGDYDNDGWKDLYLVRWGRNSLFRNNGNGTFTEVTARLFKRRDGSPGTDWANGNAAIWLDYNLDGRLDIYVGNYFDEVDLWNLKSTRIMHDSFESARNAGRNFMFRQEPDGTFTEVGAMLGLDDPGWTLAVGSADIDNNGWPDIYCADDFGPDQLFLNDKGEFRNVSKETIGSDTKKGMNVDFGDFNNDGWLDIYVTNITTAEYLQEGNMLWHNNGIGPDGMLSLTDVSLETGTYDGGWGWGAKFLDYDHDGDLDITSANGFISAGEGNYWYDLASWTVLGQDPAEARNWPTIGNRSFSGYERERFWRNDGIGSFTEVAEQVGLNTDRDGRGLAYLDYDNDGDLDIFIANQGQPANFFRNNGVAGQWLMIQLEADPATGVNRDAVGARVTVSTAKGLQIRERDGGNGYSAQSDPRIHFGLGEEKDVQLVEVRWPDGGLQYLEHVPANQILKVKQDRGKYATQMAIKVGAPEPRGASFELARDKPAPPPPADLDKHLAEMEALLRNRPQAYAPASDYREQCATYGKHDRAIEFFKKLVAEKPDDWRAKVELGCAYVDKIPTCGGLAAIVSKGTLARKSLDQLDEVVEKHPKLWVGYYTRGMNHLHWPRSLRHSDDAAADFEQCIKLQRENPQPGAGVPLPHKEGVGGGQSSRVEPHHLRIHIALGDAYAKNKEYTNARTAWRDGQKLFPESAELKERLAIADGSALLKLVESKRSLEQPIDTSLAFLDRTSDTSRSTPP
jgi:tetratricopeptide (TPR) repeat protein